MKVSKDNLSRREFFSSWRDYVTRAAGAKKTVAKREVPQGLPGFLRPPGALEETEFLEKCDRECTLCVEACPVDCIVQLGPAYQEKDKTPVILPRSKACEMCVDVPCAAACPSGALRPITKEEISLGVASILRESCYAYQNQPCDYCFIQCPIPAKAIVIREQKPTVIEDLCTGCGQCLHICPAPGDGAIEIKGSDPLRRSGSEASRSTRRFDQ